MLIQVNTDNATPGREPMIRKVEATLRYRLARFSERLTRIEVHVGDVAGGGGVDATSCTIEARPTGLAPMAVADQAPTFEQALAGAAAKAVVALERIYGKLSSRKGH